jgi:NhaA family Na+:H+ antiporter
MSAQKNGFVRFLLEFSVPLIAGVFAALLAANVAPDWYHHWFGEGEGVWQFPGHPTVFGHHLTLHFLVNDVFMVFFFGIAAKEITEACLPGGSLNPPSKAINPLFATIGGVVGPIGVFFVLLFAFHGAGMFEEGVEFSTLSRGWGIPTATDIALAWLVARAVFGRGHPAINFLLLLAVADDAIGLVIIALFYGDPSQPAQWHMLVFVLLGMGVAFGLRKMKVKQWWPYVFIAGPIAWSGLMLAHLHPALALVFIVPFLPGPWRDTGLFVEKDEVDHMGEETAKDIGLDHSPLHQFEHDLKAFVDIGLFFFAFANAGVQFAVIGPMTWIVLGALVIGKTIGISGFALLGSKIGFPLPDRMGMKQVVMAGFVAALGLTVALFVAGEAFDPASPLQGMAKMGALFSGLVGIAAVLLGRALRVREQ